VDPITHLVATAVLVGRDRRTLLAGVLADLPFYATYPPWLLWKGTVREALRSNTWPAAPGWMLRAHHVAHSLPLLALVAIAARVRSGAWPPWAAAWALHILIDIPTHSRRHWAPQFLWPLSTVTVDGVSWPERLVALWHHNVLTVSLPVPARSVERNLGLFVKTATRRCSIGEGSAGSVSGTTRSRIASPRCWP
jgi:hypothetical protein